ncbi:hypothetical protein Poli38472_005077 [Pythium oligandrum]|uniref:Uncharacterized protein n=1 Tax=Pythium oligandrum TaxID=41045 RepID=A0A8K1FIV3_PYTOL|nr:hypothetical protein Poli38472_005077 [Pythium oligandrum]|eukprot:TMW62459.1 hypothetical protein Poli38472_005077 [Pythium oligandrum]
MERMRGGRRESAARVQRRVEEDPLTQKLMEALHAPSPAVSIGYQTPQRRRASSALSLSSLVAATPPPRLNRLEIRESEPVATTDPQMLVCDATWEIQRELRAIEERLSLYRQSRTEVQSSTSEPKPDVEPVVSNQPLQEPSSDAPLSTASLHQHAEGARPPRQQVAGEMADEVESALANCERLLSRAKLQASSASLTRSLGGLSRTMHDHLDDRLDSPSHGSMPSPVPVRLRSPPTNSVLAAPEEFELETTAKTMRAFAVTCEQEMERDAAVIREQHQQAQAFQLQELQRKYESKKKMLLLTLRENCEKETKQVLQNAIATHDREQQEALERVEKTLMTEREKALTEILLKHQRDTEDRVQRLQIRLQSEMMSKKQQLEKQLQVEFETQLQQMENESELDLQRWEEKKRLELERELLKRREASATAILRAQEAKTNELKQQIQQQHRVNEEEEMTKLKKALAFGAQAQTQQLKKQLETAQEQRLQDTRTEAALSLEAKLADLKQVLSLSHKQEREQLQRELEKRHRIAVMELHEELERAHHVDIEAMRKKADEEQEKTLAEQRKRFAQDYEVQANALRQTLERDLLTRVRQLETEEEVQRDRTLQQLRQRLMDAQSMELNARITRMQQSRTVLLEEATRLLTSPSEDKISIQTDTTDTTRSLEQLLPQVSRELQRHVRVLLRDFEELAEEQKIIVAKISEATGLYLTWKRQCARMENEQMEMQRALQTMQEQVASKDAMARKLYVANEALLKRLGLEVPSK